MSHQLPHVGERPCMVERRNVATGMLDWQLARCLLL
jgi:hypothetical protein